jgi:hypothetical protein
MLPAMVGADGDIDREPLLWCQVATTASPCQNAGKEVVGGVCVPINPAKMMRELVKSGMEVANEI